MRGYPQFSFWISITIVNIYIPYITINRGKNTFELVGIVLNLWQGETLERMNLEWYLDFILHALDFISVSLIFHEIAMFLVTSPIVINMPART